MISTLLHLKAGASSPSSFLDSVNVVPQLFPQFGLAINEALHVSHLSRMRTNKKDQESIECLNACACTKRLSRK